MKKSLRYISSIFILAVLIGIDRVTKYLSLIYLKDKEPFTIIKGVLQLTYLRNTGSAWGMLEGKQTFFIIITFVMLAVMTFVFIIMPHERKYRPLCAVLVTLAAGAAGNLIDRIANGYVHDFIYFQLIDFPVFNFADICVVLSMISLVVLIFFVYKDEDFNFIKEKFRRGKKNKSSIEEDGGE